MGKEKIPRHRSVGQEKTRQCCGIPLKPKAGLNGAPSSGGSLSIPPNMLVTSKAGPLPSSVGQNSPNILGL